MTFDEWYYSLDDLDQCQISYSDAFSGWAAAKELGIKINEMQKRSVQIILDNEDQISEISRNILEGLIK